MSKILFNIYNIDVAELSYSSRASNYPPPYTYIYTVLLLQRRRRVVVHYSIRSISWCTTCSTVLCVLCTLHHIQYSTEYGVYSLPYYYILYMILILQVLISYMELYTDVYLLLCVLNKIYCILCTVYCMCTLSAVQVYTQQQVQRERESILLLRIHRYTQSVISSREIYCVDNSTKSKRQYLCDEGYSLYFA